MTTATLIVGLGQIGMGYDSENAGNGHVRSHARAFSLHPEFDLAGGVDPVAERRSRFELEYGAPAFADLGAALESARPQLVVIAVPTTAHAEVLTIVLERSAPVAILCEKPLSYDLDKAREMVRACANRGVRLFVNYMRRSDPGVAEVKRRLESGDIGVPVKGVVWYSKGLLHNGSHFFNLLEYWLGRVMETRLIAGGCDRPDGDSEPDFCARFELGTAVFLCASEEAFSHYTAELVTPNGRLSYERGGAQIRWQSTRADTELEGYTVLETEDQPIASGLKRYQWHVTDQLAAALAGRKARLCDGDAALRTLEGLLEILRKK